MKHLSHQHYKDKLHKECNERREKILREREKEGKGFLGPEKLKEIEVGAKPKESKTSTRNSKRPIVLTRCLETKQKILDWYFRKLSSHAEASFKYRSGLEAIFPTGTYSPPACTVFERELCKLCT